jgi:hypothetical protein
LWRGLKGVVLRSGNFLKRGAWTSKPRPEMWLHQFKYATWPHHHNIHRTHLPRGRRNSSHRALRPVALSLRVNSTKGPSTTIPPQYSPPIAINWPPETPSIASQLCFIYQGDIHSTSNSSEVSGGKIPSRRRRRGSNREEKEEICVEASPTANLSVQAYSNANRSEKGKCWHSRELPRAEGLVRFSKYHSEPRASAKQSL